jgi:hypothetical protein
MGRSDIEREEKHTVEREPRGRRYKYLIYGVRVCEEIDYAKSSEISAGPPRREEGKARTFSGEIRVSRNVESTTHDHNTADALPHAHAVCTQHVREVSQGA